MIVKIHKKNEKTIIAVCDSDLLGRVFEENDLQLDLSSDFYKGEKMDEKDAGDLIRNGDGVNLAGEKSVQLGVKEGIVETKDIKYIKGIPYAQVTIIHE